VGAVNPFTVIAFLQVNRQALSLAGGDFLDHFAACFSRSGGDAHHLPVVGDADVLVPAAAAQGLAAAGVD
jgi:hypothetical protein